MENRKNKKCKTSTLKSFRQISSDSSNIDNDKFQILKMSKNQDESTIK